MKTKTKEINKDEELKRKIKEAREKGTIMPIISNNCFKVMFANQADGVYDKSKITDDANSLMSYRMLFGNARIIEIEFEDNKTTKSENKENGEWLTHPAFTLNGKKLNGIWVGKFETGYNQGILESQ